MEAVLSNVKEAMTYINSEAMDVDKDAFIEHLKSRLQETLTIYYVIADQLISENGKGCNIDIKVSFSSLVLSNLSDFNLIIFVQKRIENFEKKLKPIGSRSQTFVSENPDTSLSVVHNIKNPLFTNWWNSTNNFAQSWFSIFKVTPSVNSQNRI